MELTHDCELDIMLYLESEFEDKNIIYSLQIVKTLNIYSELQVIQSIYQLLNRGFISAQVSESINSTLYGITDITPKGYEFISIH